MRFPRVHPSETLLRVGLAFSFVYPAIDAYFDPASWLGYFPHYVISAFHVIAIPLKLSDVVLLHGFGLLEVILALWILFGKRIQLPALSMAILLGVIVLTNLDPSNFSVVFRDVSIAFSALALALINRQQAKA